MRYLGPKNRISRREGVDLELKTVGSKSHARLLKKLNVPPGQHEVKIAFRETLFRGVLDIISLLSVAALVTIIVRNRK